MSKDHPFPSLSDLMKLEPLQLREFIKRSESELPDNPNWWLGIVEVVVSRAFSELSRQDTAWAEIALEVYERLINCNPENSHSFEISLMRLRINLMLAYGPQPNTLIGSPEDIVRWFFEKLTVSIEDLKQDFQSLSQNWT